MFGLSKSKPQVLVAGAGPVGLYAALNLAMRGIKVEIIDEEWRGTTHSYALALHPRSLELFDELGMADAILEKAHKVDIVGLYEGPERYAELDLGKLSSRYPFVAILAQSELEHLLVEALATQKVKVEYNHRLARIELGAHSVRATIHTLGKDSMGYAVAHTETVVDASHDVDVPLLLAADGHESLARTQLRIKFDAIRPADHFAVFEFEADGELPDEMCVVMDDRSTNVLWPMADDRYRWSFLLDDEVAPKDSRHKDRLLMDVGGYRFPHLERSYMDKLIAERAPWFKGEVDEMSWRMEVRFEYRLASAFGAGRVWLAGDAAHMAGPVGMQSMNVGLREAHDLCDIYAGILDGTEREAALTAYGAQRTAEWQTLLGVNGKLSSNDDAHPWAAKYAGRLVPCIPASSEHLTSLVGQLGLELSD